MNKEIAETIARLELEEEKLAEQKFQIQKKMGVYTWAEARTQAIKFLMEEHKNGNH